MVLFEVCVATLGENLAQTRAIELLEVVPRHVNHANVSAN